MEQQKYPDAEYQKGRLYSPPAIIHELELETRAGSPLGSPEDPFDMEFFEF